MLKNLIVDAA